MSKRWPRAEADQITTDTYRRVLRRNPDAGGHAHRSRQLQEGRISVKGLVRTFLNSDECCVARPTAVASSQRWTNGGTTGLGVQRA